MYGGGAGVIAGFAVLGGGNGGKCDDLRFLFTSLSCDPMYWDADDDDSILGVVGKPFCNIDCDSKMIYVDT